MSRAVWSPTALRLVGACAGERRVDSLSDMWPGRVIAAGRCTMARRCRSVHLGRS